MRENSSMAQKPPLQGAQGQPWRVAPCASPPWRLADVGEAAGAVDVWRVEAEAPPPGPPPGGGARPEGYRLALVREPAVWRLVTERLGAGRPGDRGAAQGVGEALRWSTEAECLGEFRAEVERLWGEAVWLALLRASASSVQRLAPAVMAPKLEELLPDRPSRASLHRRPVAAMLPA